MKPLLILFGLYWRLEKGKTFLNDMSGKRNVNVWPWVIGILKQPIIVIKWIVVCNLIVINLKAMKYRDIKTMCMQYENYIPVTLSARYLLFFAPGPFCPTKNHP